MNFDIKNANSRIKCSLGNSFIKIIAQWFDSEIGNKLIKDK